MELRLWGIGEGVGVEQEGGRLQSESAVGYERDGNGGVHLKGRDGG